MNLQHEAGTARTGIENAAKEASCYVDLEHTVDQGQLSSCRRQNEGLSSGEDEPFGAVVGKT